MSEGSSSWPAGLPSAIRVGPYDAGDWRTDVGPESEPPGREHAAAKITTSRMTRGFTAGTPLYRTGVPEVRPRERVESPRGRAKLALASRRPPRGCLRWHV